MTETLTPASPDAPRSAARRIARRVRIDPSIGTLTFALAAFLSSMLLFPFYTSGDQLFYRRLYEEIGLHHTWDEKFAFYYWAVSAIEPFFLVVVNASAAVMPKDLAFSLMNAAAAGGLAHWLLKRRVSGVIVLLLSSNFYLLVLFFSAERLKLGLLLFLFAFLLRKRWKLVLLALSVLTHFQMALLVLVYAVWRSTEGEQKYGTAKAVVLLAAAAVVAAVVVLRNPILVMYIQQKSDFYAGQGWGGVAAMAKPLLFLGVALYYATNRRQTFLAFLPLIVATYVVGSERVTLFAYFVMMYVAAPKHRGLNAAALLSSIYFGLQGLVFLVNFIQHGQGIV
jgi:hypothetical protein